MRVDSFIDQLEKTIQNLLPGIPVAIGSPPLGEDVYGVIQPLYFSESPGSLNGHAEWVDLGLQIEIVANHHLQVISLAERLIDLLSVQDAMTGPCIYSRFLRQLGPRDIQNSPKKLGILEYEFRIALA